MISRKDLRKYEGMEPETIAQVEGLEVMEVDDMPPRLEDILCLGTIVIRRAICPAERRWRIAHCLGHHFLHRGKGRARYPDKVIFNPREEREADVFAGYLIGSLLAPQWIHEVYWTMEPWKMEPWELMKAMQEGFYHIQEKESLV